MLAPRFIHVEDTPQWAPEAMAEIQRFDDRYIYPAFRELLAIGALPDNVLWILSGGRLPIQRAVAASHCTPPAILSSLSTHSDAQVRYNLAHNIASPADVLGKLAHDPVVRVRIAVAKHWDTPTQSLRALTDDPDPRVQYVVTNRVSLINRQRRTRQDTLLRKIDQQEAHQNEAWHDTAPSIADADCRERRRIAADAATPASVLAMLARDTSSHVRSAVAYNPHTSPSVLEHLSHDPSTYVRSFVAWNTSTPTDALARLLDQDTNFLLYLGLARNPHTPRPVLEAIVPTYSQLVSRFDNESHAFRWAMYHHPHTTAHIHARLLPNTLNDFVAFDGRIGPVQQAIALAHPHTHPQTIVSYTQSRDWKYAAHSYEWLPRYAIALNPNTPLETLMLLKDDPHPTVREQVQRRLAATP